MHLSLLSFTSRIKDIAIKFEENNKFLKMANKSNKDF
jgi:hypothetical protein